MKKKTGIILLAAAALTAQCFVGALPAFGQVPEAQDVQAEEIIAEEDPEVIQAEDPEEIPELIVSDAEEAGPEEAVAAVELFAKADAASEETLPEAPAEAEEIIAEAEGLTAEELILAEYGMFTVGNTAEALLSGGVIAVSGETVYSAEGGDLICQTGEYSTTLVYGEDASSLNLFDGALWYASGTEVCRMDLSSGTVEVMAQAPARIDELAVVNDAAVYYLADGTVYGPDGTAAEGAPSVEINGFYPTSYGILYQTGSLFNRIVYAGANYAAGNLYSWTVEDDELLLTAEGEYYTLPLASAFAGEEVAGGLTLYAGETASLEELTAEHGECDVCEENAALAANEEIPAADTLTDQWEEEAVSAYTYASAGQRNIVRRALQQLKLNWTPQQDIGGWVNETTFKKGVTYTGIPYGQPIYGQYVPYNSDNYTPNVKGLENFIQAVNTRTSKMYTDRGRNDYNYDSSGKAKTCPYYSSDCSGFVTYSLGLNCRTVTAEFPSRKDLTKLPTQSVYSCEVGDILNRPSSHVVLITDVGYTSTGKIVYVDISEQTPPITKTTRYGEGGTRTMADLQSRYIGGGYTMYRYNNRGSVAYPASSVITVSENLSVTNTAPTVPVAQGSAEDILIPLYEGILGRTPSSSELKTWAKAMNGGTTAADVAVTFLYSAEGANKMKGERDLIIRLYKGLLDRSPSSSEIRHWIDTTRSYAYTLEGLLGSAEFTRRCQDAGVGRGTFKATDILTKYPKVAGFVERLYNYCLDRDPEEGGFVNWTDLLLLHEKSGATTAYGFFFSKEFQNKRYSAADFVAILYRVMLDRKYDAAGYEYWIAKLNSGYSKSKIFDGFAGSKEFTNLCEKYGIQRG